MARKPTYEELEQRVNALEAENEKKGRFLRESRDGVYHLDLQNNEIEFYNDLYKFLFKGTDGKVTKKSIAKTLARSMSPEEMSAIKHEVAESLQSGKEGGEVDYKLQFIDGTYHWFHDRWKIVRDDRGNAIAIEGIIRDITEIKQKEEVLRESENKYRNLIESLQEGIWAIDQNNHTTFVNVPMTHMLGYTVEEMLGKPLFSFMDERGREIVEHYLERRRQGIKEQHEFEFIRKDGIRIFTLIETKPFFDDDGNYRGAIAGVIDITERKQAEKALRESEEKYRELFDNIDSGVAIYKAIEDGNDFIFEDFNKSGERIDHILRNELIGKSVLEKFPGVKDFGLFDAFQRVWRTGQPERHPISMYKDERIIGWRDNFIYKLPSGDVVAIYSDETERKQAEEALRDSRNMLRTVLDSIPSAVFWKDRDSIYLGGNRTWLEAAGINSLEEVVGKSDYDLPWEKEQADSFREDDRRIMESGIPEYEIIEPYFRADGTHAWARTNKVPLRDTEGNVTGILGTYKDITERKCMEEELKRSREQLRNLSNYLLQVREQERTQIARDIHDELGQALTGLKMDLAWLEEVIPGDPKSALEKVLSMKTLIDDEIKFTKNMIANLRPGILDDLGLIPAIEWQAEEFQKRAGIHCELFSEMREYSPREEISTSIFRIFQESLTNVARHANATLVRINLEQREKKLVLTISDNGSGIMQEQISSARSFGLMGMRERANQFGGEVDISGIRGRGTTVTVRIPFGNDSEEAWDD